MSYEQEREFYHWLCFVLWQTGKFEPCLAGSVILYIHITDVKDITRASAMQVYQKPQQYQKALVTLIEIDNQPIILSELVNMHIGTLAHFLLPK